MHLVIVHKIRSTNVVSVFYDIISMIHALIFCDVLLVLGVSGFTFLPILKLLSRKKVIVNVDGLEWRRAKWSGTAKKFLKFSEKIAVRYADEIITDNAAIQKYVVDTYDINPHLIEYGSAHVSPVALKSVHYEKYPFLESEYAFKVCRIEPENNIQLVLEAFARYGKMTLVMVGNWNHSYFGREVRKLYSQYENLHLLDPIYDQKELNLLRSNCDLYVHGHSAGGTNPSLVEAMNLRLPILAFDVIYNRITTQQRALYFESAEDIITRLEMMPSTDLEGLASNLKWVAEHKYTWNRIAERYRQAAESTERLPRPVFDFELPSTLKKAS